MTQVTAVDDNRRMLEFARRQAAAAGATVRFLEGRLEELFSTESGLPVSKIWVLLHDFKLCFMHRRLQMVHTIVRLLVLGSPFAETRQAA